MKPLLRISALLVLSMGLFVTSCNDDEDPYLSPSNQRNVNSNSTFAGSIKGACDDDAANLQAVANRLEMPRLKGGSSDLFIVHTVPTYGVNYCMEYDCSLRAQRWAAFRWDKSNSRKSVNRTNAWDEDPLIPKAYRTGYSDHSYNGYTRGHIVASEDRVNSREANMQTFYYSNMHPQHEGFNTQGIWWNLENLKIRDAYNVDSFRDTLYVVKGGTIDSGNYTLAKGIPVPKYFFMALLCKKNSDQTQGGYKAIAFWMEHKVNTDDNYKNYAISIDRLEELTGIDFFCNLPDDIEAVVESNLVTSAWKL